MNTSLKLYALTGLTLGMNAFNCLAAESIVYTFKDGTVTVTPRDPQTAPIPKLETQRANAVSDIVPAPLPQLSEQPQLIRPVSHTQVSPEPATNEVVPPKSQPTPMPPEAKSQPGCCDDQLPVILPRSTDALPKTTTTLSTAAMYRDVYNSIPFSRVEFNHYPNYRHDATMEFLFNQMRTTIINRNTGSAGNDYSYGPAYGGYMGYPYYDPPAYPFSYGLRIHRSR